MCLCGMSRSYTVGERTFCFRLRLKLKNLIRIPKSAIGMGR